MAIVTNLDELMKEKGYTLAAGYADAKKQVGSSKMILLPSYYQDNYTRHAGALPYAIDRNSTDLSLSQIVEVAIEQLFVRMEQVKIEQKRLQEKEEQEQQYDIPRENRIIDLKTKNSFPTKDEFKFVLPP